MSTRLSDRKSGVFWDVDDFPVPEGRGIREIVESNLEKQGYKGEASITVYGEKDPFSPEETAKGRFTFVKRSDKYWRLHKMLTDIGLWVLEIPDRYRIPTNVVVVAKNISENTDFVRFLEELDSVDFNVSVVFPDDVKPAEVNIPEVRFAWYWKDFLEVGDPIPAAEYRILLDQGERDNMLFDPDDCGDDYSGEYDNDGGEYDEESCRMWTHY
ncbi:unnamed protein product [Microthlaspi erraticum]|uniref:NYN domain-containing protein n=1 Tax=Microthlaspi erraticum TaxID=1685480 RepID=A0A6D2JXL2_9BRAS|nr:unnamed protein product [Microthlaspi erraticum]CAA7052511.1 unnamed protein product [Microthlaspi erraticum]